MQFEFSGKIWSWRGPAPYFFVSVPETHSRALKEISRSVTYGWGVIPVLARVGKTEWMTSLIPKSGLYLVPLKDSLRAAENLAEGMEISLQIEVR